MNRIELLVRIWMLTLATGMVAGCGSSGDAPSASVAEATESTSEAATPETTVGEPEPSATTEVALAAATIEVAAPTAEQITRWTPAPFEAVELLAVREWKKTSFTSELAATADGKHFIVVGSRVVLWSIDKDEPEHVFLELTEADGDRTILSLAVSPDGKWFAVGDSNGVVRIWTLADRKEVITKELDSSGITCLAISPDGQEIASISYDSDVHVWSADTLEERKSFKVDTNGLKKIDYVAPGRLAAAGETTTLWDTQTGTQVQELSPGRYSFALARSPDGTRFLFGGDDSLQIWNVAEGKTESEIAHGVSGSELVAFSPDGQFFATSNGRSVQLWNLAERRAVQVIEGFGWPIVGVSWLPETNLLAVASDIGCTRLWGTPQQGAAVGLKPLHSPLPKLDAKAPATQDQLAEVIDLQTFPRLPGCEPNMSSAADFGCAAAVTVGEAQTFYRYFLEQAGWKMLPVDPINPAAIEFQKDGCRLSVSCYDGGDGKTSVMVHHAGNFDLRLAPKFDAAPTESTYENANVIIYRTKADLLSIETALLRQFHAAGWSGYSRLKTSHSETADQRDLDFLRNGTTLRVSIGKFPVDPESYTIQYSLFPNNSWAPVPPDAGFVEFDGSTEPALVARTSMSLDEASDFYTQALIAQGWLPREKGRSEKDDRAWVSFLRKQSDLSVGLTKLEEGGTLVQIGDTGGSLWDLSQAEEEPAGDAPEAGLQAADFPILNATKTAAFDALGQSVEVRIDKSTLAAAAEEYTKALEKLGWKPEEGGIRSEDYTFLTFKKDEQEIALRARLTDGNAVVNFQGDGLLWTKELPIGRQLVSFETWLRRNKHPAGLERLDEYEAAMRAIQSSPASESKPQ
jgi:hypothetical protein